jgi:hypothetical protein
VLVLFIRAAGENKPPDLGPMSDAPEKLIALEIGKIEEQLAGLR